MHKNYHGLDLLSSKIADCARTAFRPYAIDDPHGRGYRPCRFWQDLRAARANSVFRADEKRIRTENTVMVNTEHSAWVLYKIADWARICFSSAPNR
jgi:hypothetical protein